ncbi:nucleoside diphosphate kinase, partial [Coemansia mojavensis]
QKFYAEHLGKPFYPRLISYMTSGPILALALTKQGAIREWREMIGSTRPAQMRIENPRTLRAQFGLTDTRNSFHGSDSADSASRELEFFF